MQNAGERSEFGSQTATRSANRPELRGFLPTWKPRRFAETGWWSKGDSNRDALGDAFVNLRAFRIENQQFRLEFPPPSALTAEAALRGQARTKATIRAAAEAELANAVPLCDNGFKIELAKRVIVAVLTDLAGDMA